MGWIGFLLTAFVSNIILSINCTFRPSDWRSAVGNLRFFDPQVAAFCGDKRRNILGEGETKIFLNFHNVSAAHSVFNILGYW